MVMRGNMKMKQKLTNTVISNFNCPEGKQKGFLSDTEVSGLKLRVTASGAKSFTFEKRPKGTGKLRIETLGRVGDISIDQARAMARQKVIEFDDPNYLYRLAEQKTRKSFSDVYDQYKSLKMSLLAQSTREKQDGYFRREILPVLKDFPIETVTRANISNITLSIQQSGREGAAQDVWKSASAFLTWCVQQGYIGVNPIYGSTPKFNVQKRDRVLSLEEVVKIWHATEEFTPVRRSAVRLLLLMPFRKGELTASLWGDYDGNHLTMPATRTKKSRAISLPISDFAKTQLPPPRNDTGLMFSTDGHSTTRLDDKLLKRLIAVSGVPKFCWHDFRRTFDTHLQETHSADYIAIDACLNHVNDAQKGVAGVYNRANYADRIHAVMMQWSAIVEEAVNGK